MHKRLFFGLLAFLAVFHPKKFEWYSVADEFLSYAPKFRYSVDRCRCLLFWKKQSL